MDEDIQLDKTSKASPILLAVGVLGFLFGLTAIALSLSAMVKVGSTSSEMNDKIEKAAALALDMKKMNDKFDAITAQVESIKGGDNARVDELSKQTSAAVQKLGEILRDTRAQIEENRKAIESLARGKSPSRTHAKTESSTTASDSQQPTESTAAQNSSSSTAASSDGETYKIQSGDTFARLAPKFGVSIEALKRANPDVNPSRLRIGQTINIPKK